MASQKYVLLYFAPKFSARYIIDFYTNQYIGQNARNAILVNLLNNKGLIDKHDLFSPGFEESIPERLKLIPLEYLDIAHVPLCKCNYVVAGFDATTYYGGFETFEDAKKIAHNLAEYHDVVVCQTKLWTIIGISSA